MTIFKKFQKYNKMSKNDTIFKKCQNYRNVKNWQILKKYDNFLKCQKYDRIGKIIKKVKNDDILKMSQRPNFQKSENLTFFFKSRK